MCRFGSTVGQFVLLAGFRAQVAPGRDGEFKEVSQERYVWRSIVTDVTAEILLEEHLQTFAQHLSFFTFSLSTSWVRRV